jgi:hypothetical protein
VYHVPLNKVDIKKQSRYVNRWLVKHADDHHVVGFSPTELVDRLHYLINQIILLSFHKDAKIAGDILQCMRMELASAKAKDGRRWGI